MPLASRDALSARAAATIAAPPCASLSSSPATCAVRLPNSGSCLRAIPGAVGSVGIGRFDCARMIVLRWVKRWVGVNGFPSADHAQARSCHPRPRTRIRICSLSASSLADVEVSLEYSLVAWAAVFQHTGAPHISK
eukprot:7387930-Prymnesium_polylepis.1